MICEMNVLVCAPLLSRIILASTQQGDLILDPFAGGCTTGIAANLFTRKFVGIDISEEYLKIGKCRSEKLGETGKFLKKKILKVISNKNYFIFGPDE